MTVCPHTCYGTCHTTYRPNSITLYKKFGRRVVLICKKKDPRDSKNCRAIYVSTAIYGILTRLFLKRITKTITLGLLNIQHGALFFIKTHF